MPTGKELVDYAVNIGTGRPYVLGAAGPNAYDCSGLILAVFQHFNLATFPNLPREAGAQARWLGVHGKWVTIGEASKTPGAILAIDHGPSGSGAGAGGNHIAFCRTPGFSFEARSRALGIGTWPLSAHSWTGAYLIPGVDYGTAHDAATEPPEEGPDLLPYYMLKSAKYRDIFAVFGGDMGRTVEPLLGPGEFNTLLAKGVPYNDNVDDEEINRAHAESGSTVALSPV